jgi:hypothetical protein
LEISKQQYHVLLTHKGKLSILDESILAEFFAACEFAPSAPRTRRFSYFSPDAVAAASETQMRMKFEHVSQYSVDIVMSN